MSREASLVELVEDASDRFADRPALIGVDGTALTYAMLTRTIRALGRDLRERGVGREDRVALVLPAGVPAATALVGASAFCSCAPFNPGYGVREFEAFFEDHRPKALIAARRESAAARLAAGRFGVPVWDWAVRADSHDRSCRLSGPSPYAPSADGQGQSLDVGLTLYTSGTTSRPKLVPLSQANLSASARNIAEWLRLGPRDRCLNVMPLFHIHGLVAGVLASLAAGASVVCTPGFSAVDFFRWLDDCAPTWYTAVPTMHQAVLARYAELGDRSRAPRLRFVRSSSAPLAPDVMAALESVFQAPVVEAYGMTEATHQMASNPLPPSRRKAGSVGLPAGAEVAILDEARHQPVPQGDVGEVAVRGPGVTAGYVDSPQANADAFAGGWFRTGDQGYLDPDGYLVLTGRLKELINRGGEKVAPREIDEALLAHPAVSQAVAFAIPDPDYGESVGAAVVLRAGWSVEEYELQRHVAGRLAAFKVPCRIVIAGDVPKGPTGKLQRRGLAAAFGLTVEGRSSAEGTHADPAIERDIAAAWCDVLDRTDVPAGARFIGLGGDSLAAARLVNRLRARFGVELSLADALAASTVREQAVVVRRALDQSSSDTRSRSYRGLPPAMTRVER
jgi:acyl-CoA synthetase (AMP-forming)/AMP-acid ligase II/acyl carrier protein